MASSALRAESALVTLPPHFSPMPVVMETLARFDRQSLEGFISVAIGLLDIVDGDPDVELNGDETDHSGSEECFVSHGYSNAAGCPVGDPDAEHDGCEQDCDGI